MIIVLGIAGSLIGAWLVIFLLFFGWAYIVSATEPEPLSKEEKLQREIAVLEKELGIGNDQDRAELRQGSSRESQVSRPAERHRRRQ